MARSNSPKYKHVVVLGNGFDMASELPTSYNDFIESVQFSELESNENFLAKHLRSVKDLQKWVDIEQELAKASNDFEYDEKSSALFLTEYKILIMSLINYISNIDYEAGNLKGDNFKFVNRLIGDGPLCILNFNYTETVSRMFSDRLDKFTLIHVHGSAKKQDIVFGVSDTVKINKEHVFLRKGAAPGLYTDWRVGDIMKNATDSVSIFGHSLGESDTTQFYPFFGPGEHTGASNLNLYYHSENTYWSLFRELERLTSKNLQRFRTQHKLHMIGPDIKYE